VLRFNAEKEKALANPSTQKHNILEMPDIYSELMKYLSFADASRLRQTFKIADLAFYKHFTHHPDRLLRELGYLTEAQLQKFIDAQKRHDEVLWQQLQPNIDNPAAYACYALIGYVNNLELERLDAALHYLSDNSFPAVIIQRLEYVKSKIICHEGMQGIPFLDTPDLLKVVFKNKKIPELARLRETCRMANHRFNQMVFANPAGVLQTIDQLNDRQLRGFLLNNAAHLESLEPFVANYDAAYASYALLGGVRLLNPERLPGVLEFLEEQHTSQLIIHCVELVHAIYCPSINYIARFSDLMERMAKDYLDDRNLGTLRPLFIDLLFRATQSLENNESLLLDHRYQLVFHFLAAAQKHELFSVHRDRGVAWGLFATVRVSSTHSQDVIAAENKHAHERFYAKEHLTHPKLSN
jgi:hypothetical protein